jgi:hypothetical protein
MPALIPAFPVFIRRGDARAEVDRLVRELGPTAEKAGFQKYIYASQADQTVVMTSGRDAPLANALRTRPGWDEPKES